LECRRCGAGIAEDAAYCSACGQATKEHADDIAQPHSAPRAVSRAPAKPRIAYAGFWLRAVAYVIDTVLLAIVSAIFVLGPLSQRAGISTQNPWVFFTNGSRQVLAINLLMLMVQWLYWALLESSPWQATVGKRILGLYVTDMEGKRITFARASGRYFAMMISTLTLCVGYLMAGFTPKKQALHDMIAECLVLKITGMRP
jgi:uncharacterized RDD family membrane protein YckC